MWKVIPNSLFYDKDVGDRAKFLYMEIASRGDNVVVDDTITTLFGGNNVRNLLDQLEGYMSYDIDMGNTITASVVSEPVTVVKEVVESENKTTSKNKEKINNIISHYNNVFSPRVKIKVTEKICEMLNARLKSFSESELMDAVSGRHHIVSNNDWYKTRDGKPHFFRTDLIFRSDDAVQKCLIVDRSEPEKIGDSVVKSVDISSSSSLLD